jgi:N-acetylmuramoyl-L-alanine amidase
MRARTRVLCGVAICAGVVLVAAIAPASDRRERIGPSTFGHSVQGRAIEVVRIGDPRSRRKALVVGAIHGDEGEGVDVTREILRSYSDIRGVDLWVVHTVNPDGLAAGTRRNAHGVDLNRNFSHRWQPGDPSSGYYSGPEPFSEPESRAVRRLVRRSQPRVTIWFHQPWNQVLAPCTGDASLHRRFSQLSGIPLKRCRGARLPGTATRWQDHTFPGTEAFVVELAGGSISDSAERRYARAAVRVARDGAEERGRADRRTLPKPPIRRRPIPFGDKRRREMAAYSKRHYGKREWRLRNPKVIVQHVAVAGSIDSVYNTFAPDHPDPELHELPNVCSHFVIGSSGRIVQLVGLRTRCRHTVGLNYTAIGIEHVGFSDGDLLGNRRQLRASLRLTRWLRCRFGIKVENVIGHNESLRSPYHFERVPSLQQQTHGDMKRASMRVYRRKLSRRGPCP